MTRICMTLLIILVTFLLGSCFPGGPAKESGIEAHWEFDVLTQNDGMTPDTSGNGHHGRIHGQQLVDGIIDNAMKFEGLHQIVETGDLGISAPATIAFWFKTDDLFHDRRFFSQLEGTENQAGALRLDGVQIEIWDGSDWQVLIDRYMKVRQWMHLAVVFEPDGKTSGYLNGNRQHLVRCGFDYTGVKAAIGGKFLNVSGNTYTGCMDDFRMYSRVLSADEISSLYSQR